MNNKGFTLVELLAVIIILSSMSLVVVSSVSSSLLRRDERECFEQKEIAKNAAKIYFSLHDNNNVRSVSISTLKTDGYFNSNNKIDRLNDDDTVIVNNDSYEYNGECKTS